MTQMAKHRSNTDFSRLPNFPRTFQSKYLIGKRKTRTRKFTPAILFHTLLELVAGTNKEGYVSALLKSFDFTGKNKNDAPATKGALCKIRARISFKFFRDFFLGSSFNLGPTGGPFKAFGSTRSTGLRSHCPEARKY
jgi:hypothetical protein